jgi:hypothetical protein
MNLYSGRHPLQTVTLLARIHNLPDFGLAFGAVEFVVVRFDGLHGQPLWVVDEVGGAAFIVVQEVEEEHLAAGPAAELLLGVVGFHNECIIK